VTSYSHYMDMLSHQYTHPTWKRLCQLCVDSLDADSAAKDAESQNNVSSGKSIQAGN